METMTTPIFLIFLLIQVFSATSFSRLNQQNKILKSDPPFQCAENGFYPIGECSPQYYICVDGNVYPAVCPPNSLFDPSLSTCVSIDNLPSCQTTTTTTTVSSNTATPSGSTTTKPIECTQDGFYAFSDCQSVYYACVSGVPYFQECPNNSIFVEAETSCKPIESTDCPVPTTTMKPFVCPDNNTGFYPIYPEACTGSYYTCVEGEAYLQSCQDDFIFDVTLGGCTPPDMAACNQPARGRSSFKAL